MATIIQSFADEIGDPEALPSPAKRLQDFFASVAVSAESALLLDFDGTLAPFRIDPSKVRPWAGVAGLLDEIQNIQRTRVAIITGRPAADVADQLGSKTTPEIWGLHGSERRYSDGRIEEQELNADQQQLLSVARRAIHSALPGIRVENKRNAIVVHWRGESMHSAQRIQRTAFGLLSAIADGKAVRLLQFDGGLELRTGRDKGDAVRLILGELRDDAPVAYLGDDTTDEHAFEALAGCGLTVLVRKEQRPSAAEMWLRPPVQLREFLASWLRAIQS